MQLDWLKYMYDNKQAYIGAALILNMQVSYGIWTIFIKTA